jgi:hypothetical protein
MLFLKQIGSLVFLLPTLCISKYPGLSYQL